MKARVQCLLRRCINPACGVLFHPPREVSVYCRACSTDPHANPNAKQRRKGAQYGNDQRSTA